MTGWIWAGIAGSLALAVVLLAWRQRRADASRVRLDARLATVLAGPDAGVAVWDQAGRLIGSNERFREFFPRAPLRPGVAFEDLVRYLATRGIVDVADDDIERWVNERVARFGQTSHEVLQTADHRWVDVYLRTSDAGEVVLLYIDTTSVRADAAGRAVRRAPGTTPPADLAVAADIAAVLDEPEVPPADRLRRVLARVCTWSGWPVGCAYRAIAVDGRPRVGELLAWHAAPESAAAFADLQRAVGSSPTQPGDGFAGRALQAGSLVWVPNVAVDPGVGPGRRALMPGIRGACAVPVVKDGEVRVVFEFLSRDPLAPDPAAGQLLETVARVAAWALAANQGDRPDPTLARRDAPSV